MLEVCVDGDENFLVLAAIDYAHLLQQTVDEDYPEALMITIVQDNLNTRSPASLYKAFEPAEARRILNRLVFCYTPKHGSWLNMAEIELKVLHGQCLDRRIPEFDILQAEVEAWVEQRNQQQTWIDWRFTTGSLSKIVKVSPVAKAKVGAISFC